MRSWWSGLALREKQIFTMGLLLTTLFLIYVLVFAPLSNSVNQLRLKVRSDQVLLTWMKASNDRITSLEKNHQSPARNTSMSLLTIVQNGINDSSIAQNVSQLQQSDNDSVQLQIQKVNFDSFVQWLSQLCLQNNLLITQISIVPNDNTGSINTELKLVRA